MDVSDIFLLGGGFEAPGGGVVPADAAMGVPLHILVCVWCVCVCVCVCASHFFGTKHSEIVVLCHRTEKKGKPIEWDNVPSKQREI